MENDNKPLETDSSELEQFLEEGNEDVVGEETPIEALTLEELNKASGREFKSKDDFFKHYTNLKSFVGKKAEPEEEKEIAPQQKPALRQEIAELKAHIAQRDFIIDNPEAKENLDLIKSVSIGDKITLAEAWEKVKPLVEGAEARKKELEIGVKSKNRNNPLPSKEISNLASQVRETGGDEQSRQELVSKWLGLNK